MGALLRIFAQIFMRICQILPIQKNKIVFSSFQGKRYNDSPRVLSEALHEQGEYDQVWILPESVEAPDYVRKVRGRSLAELYELATAKVWIDNCRKDVWVRKRKGQLYIQTWHGGVALKKVEKDAQDTLPAVYVKSAINDSRMADYFVSESAWRTNNYRQSFWYDGPIIEGGIVRAQKIEETQAREKVRQALNLDANTQIALYAPTFRSTKALDCYDIDYTALLKALEEKFGGNWVVVVRLHPNISHLNEQITYSEKLINGTNYPVLNELMAAASVVITDFSGCMFDALREGKYLFLYASDYERYITQERGLYFDLSTFPNGICKSNDQLIETIRAFDKEDYEAKYAPIVEKLGFYTADGTQQVADIIKGFTQ